MTSTAYVPFRLLPWLPGRRCFYMTKDEIAKVDVLRRQGLGYAKITQMLGIKEKLVKNLKAVILTF